jgi:5S rRNA maturation endonuclease (ribonuclease M5)
MSLLEVVIVESMDDLISIESVYDRDTNYSTGNKLAEPALESLRRMWLLDGNSCDWDLSEGREFDYSS